MKLLKFEELPEEFKGHFKEYQMDAVDNYYFVIDGDRIGAAFRIIK